MAEIRSVTIQMKLLHIVSHVITPNAFSKSLIIHDENTKEITTVKEVLISCLNLHRFWQFHSFGFSSFNDQFEKLYQTLETVFLQVSKRLEVG